LIENILDWVGGRDIHPCKAEWGTKESTEWYKGRPLAAGLQKAVAWQMLRAHGAGLGEDKKVIPLTSIQISPVPWVY